MKDHIIKFNDVDLSSRFNYMVQGLTFAPGGKKLFTIDLPGKDGVHSQGNAINSGTVIIQLAFYGDTTDEVYTNVGRFLSYMMELGKCAMESSRQAGYIKYVELSTCEEYTVIKGEDTCYAAVDIQFLMSDPYTYSINPVTKSFGPGKTVNISISNNYTRTPFKIKFANAPGSSKVTVADTDPSIVLLNNSGEIFRINGNFDVSVTVDTKEYTVKDYYGNSLIPKWDGDMPELKQGTNTFRAECFQSEIIVTVEYVERML